MIDMDTAHPNKGKNGSTKELVEVLQTEEEAIKNRTGKYSYNPFLGSVHEIMRQVVQAAYMRGVRSESALNHVKLHAPSLYKKFCENNEAMSVAQCGHDIFAQEYLLLLTQKSTIAFYGAERVKDKEAVIRYFYDLYKSQGMTDLDFGLGYIQDLIKLTSGHRSMSKLTTVLVDDLVGIVSTVFANLDKNNDLSFYNMKKIIDYLEFYEKYPLFSKEQRKKMNSMVVDCYIQRWYDSLEYLYYVADLSVSYQMTDYSFSDDFLSYKKELIEYALNEIAFEYDELSRNKDDFDVPYDLFFDQCIGYLTSHFKRERNNWGWYDKGYGDFSMPFILDGGFYQTAPTLKNDYPLYDSLVSEFTAYQSHRIKTIMARVYAFIHDKSDDLTLEFSSNVKVDIFNNFVLRLMSDIDRHPHVEGVINDITEEYKKRIRNEKN